MAEFSIREMYEEDIVSVLEVDVLSFTAPWTEEIFKLEINHNQFAHYFVIEEGEIIVGYVGLWIVEDDAQITNIALHPNYRGFKIGEKLFGFAVQYAMKQGAIRLSL